MGKILCSTRGGEASYRAQDAAIALAKERGDTLLFLYVVDLHFLDKTSGAAVVDVEKEMNKMGEFLLLMAKERAAEQNVVAETTCHTGEFREELENTAREQNTSLIVLGRPADTESVFQLTSLQTFAAEIESETGVETCIV
ncbi:MAG: universal stress protein [Chloroflexi bacterium]|nr:universal stress protein [Chloroflexota bacterium]